MPRDLQHVVIRALVKVTHGSTCCISSIILSAFQFLKCLIATTVLSSGCTYYRHFAEEAIWEAEELRGPWGTQLVSGGALIQSYPAELCSPLHVRMEAGRCSRKSHWRDVSPRLPSGQGWLPRGTWTHIGCEGQTGIIWNEWGGGFWALYAKRASRVLGTSWGQLAVHQGWTTLWVMEWWPGMTQKV